MDYNIQMIKALEIALVQANNNGDIIGANAIVKEIEIRKGQVNK